MGERGEEGGMEHSVKTAQSGEVVCLGFEFSQRHFFDL